MIISNQHKFIFVHCRKAAGSSVVSSLSRYLGPHDLQFSAIPDGIPLHIRPPRRVIKEALQTMAPADYLAILCGRKSFWRTVSSSIKARYADSLGRSPAHASASAVAATFPDEWHSYFKFCVVRNPWDKTLSDYFWRTKRLENPPSFDEFVEALECGRGLPGIAPENHRNWDMYAIDGQVAVDYVVRFEELIPGLTAALARTTVPWDGWLPHMKKGAETRRPNRDYRLHYSDRSAEVVGRLCAEEIRTFNYTF
jgi:hypothetical protein